MTTTANRASKNARQERFGTFTLLNVSDLHTDGTYQRPLSTYRVRVIVLNYEPILFQPLIVGLRNGVYYVVDGQHRLEAAKELGFAEVPCMIYETTSVEAEAKAFVWLQKFRRRITGPQQFTARLAYKDTAAVAIAKLLTSYGFEIGTYDRFETRRHNNLIYAVKCLEQAYDEGGTKRVEDMLSVLRNAWDGRAAALERSILLGLWKFMKANPYSAKALGERLKQIDPPSLRMAAMSITRSRGLKESDACAAVIANVYRRVSPQLKPK